ncbi:MAG: hypothetical protein M1835_003543, partial [Candelina submexicana]
MISVSNQRSEYSNIFNSIFLYPHIELRFFEVTLLDDSTEYCDNYIARCAEFQNSSAVEQLYGEEEDEEQMQEDGQDDNDELEQGKMTQAEIEGRLGPPEGGDLYFRTRHDQDIPSHVSRNRWRNTALKLVVKT